MAGQDGNTNSRHAQGPSQNDVRIQLSKELEHELDKLAQLFWISKDKLKEITEHFGKELEDGLQEDGRNIAMYVTWVTGFPTGEETGKIMTLDLGGTNLRVCWVILTEQKGETEVIQSQYRMPEELKTGQAEQLWDFVTESLEKFIREHDLRASKEEPLPLGFTFSYPAIQDRIDHGVLQTWTKGFDIHGVEGEDVATQLREAMRRRDLPVELMALVNDTTGALIASAYSDPDTVIGAIFGTGCNAAYMEAVSDIPKLKGKLSPDTMMAINCEYGAFDNSRKVLPLTQYDKTIDAESPRPGEQAFEKTSAGLYLGEIFRLVLLDACQNQLLFRDQDVSKLEIPYQLDTGFLSALENDESNDLSGISGQFTKHLSIDAIPSEREFSRRVAEMVAVRGARLCACGVAAICRRRKIQMGHVAADGSVANKHPKFQRRWGDALAEILDWPEQREANPIVLTSAEDGSGIGAAVITAMTMKSAHRKRALD